MPGKTRACKKELELEKDGKQKIMSNTRAKFENHTSPHVYDYLVVEAYYNGLVSNSTQYIKVVNAAQRFQETFLGMSVEDFPKRCLDPKHEEWIKNVSFKNSQQFFTGNMNDFWESYNKLSNEHFCVVDFEKVLEEKSWQEFFKSLI